MKKFTTIAAALFLLHSSYAQIEKGKTFIGGSIGFGNSKNETSATSYSKNGSWNISPQIGKAVKQNLIVGIQLSAGGNSSESTGFAGISKNTSGNYGLGFFARKYYPVANKFMLFGEGRIGGNILTGDSKIGDVKITESNGWGINLNIAPGIAYNVSKKLWIEAALTNLFNAGYSSATNKQLANGGQPASESKNTSFNANASISGLQDFGIGVRWIL